MKSIGSTVSMSVAGAALLSLAIACGAPTSPHHQSDPDENPPDDDGQAMLIPTPAEASAPPAALQIADPSHRLT